MTFLVPRLRPGGGDVRQSQPCARKTPGAGGGERASAAPGADHRIAGDEALLLAHAGVSAAQIHRLERVAQHWNVPLREVARAGAIVDSRSYLWAVAAFCGLRGHNWSKAASLRPLQPAPEPYRLLAGLQPVPLERPQAGYAINGEDAPAEAIAGLADALGPARDRLVLMSRRELAAAIAGTYGAQIALQAADGLRQRNPRMSAATGLIRWQVIFLAAAAGLFLGAAVFAPRETTVVYSACLSLMFLVTICMRVAAALHASWRAALGRRRRYPRIAARDLPRYTVMVAMFREARVLPQLVEALCGLKYPRAKLEVKLVLEEVDAETIAAARALDLPPHFEVVIVPDGKPRTKPRALNYALQFATGDYLVIYDAEDRPDPFQLRKAAAQFGEAAPEVACLQAKLIFDNAFENWLSKQFTIEYASLFGGILPMLDRARLPLPLGGTSNHFRTRILRRIGGWDAHNVTEDADLGMRLYRAGLRAEVLESTTYEEAACQPGNWLRQRTRWLKGWIQTYGVHMRQPWRLYRELGPRGFLAFQGHFAGIIIAALVHPLSYGLIIHDAVTGMLFLRPQTFFGLQLWAIALFNLAAGYLASLMLGFFALQAGHVRRLIPQLVFIPAYWLFTSAAAYRAVYQLIVAPHYWEKTEHGVTRMRRPTTD